MINSQSKLTALFTFFLLTVSGCTSFTENSTTLATQTTYTDNNISATITEPGSYTFTGKTDPITINVTKDDDVEIILNNAEITSNDTPPIYVQEAKNVKILLAQNSTNTITDNRTATEEIEDFPNAAVFSMSDLSIEGIENSKLIITANLHDGIASKDDLTIENANIEVTAKDDGIRGKDSLEITKSKINITAEGDGLRSNNNEDIAKGIITLSENDITISAGDDGIDAVQKIEFINGTTLISKSYEGVEALNILIHDGNLTINSEDDGINVAETSEDEENGFIDFGARRPGGESVIDGIVEILGGETTIIAEGDGFDSNGNAAMSGGILSIHGPTKDNNGPIDVNGTFTISGGTLLAIGSAGMAETPDQNSTQNSLQINFENTYPAGTQISLKDSQENELASTTAQKQFQSVTFSSADLEVNESYSTYIDGTKNSEITLTGAVTIEGSEFKRGPGGPRRNEKFKPKLK